MAVGVSHGGVRTRTAPPNPLVPWPSWGCRGRESPASSPEADTRAHKDTQSHRAKTKATMTHASAQIWGSSGVKPVGAGGAKGGVEGAETPAGRWESGARKSPKLEVAMCHGPPQSVGGATRQGEVCNLDLFIFSPRAAPAARARRKRASPSFFIKFWLVSFCAET